MKEGSERRGITGARFFSEALWAHRNLTNQARRRE
jgi:hypothetical protein